jgi:hypothetical protein
VEKSWKSEKSFRIPHFSVAGAANKDFKEFGLASFEKSFWRENFQNIQKMEGQSLNGIFLLHNHVIPMVQCHADLFSIAKAVPLLHNVLVRVATQKQEREAAWDRVVSTATYSFPGYISWVAEPLADYCAITHERMAVYGRWSDWPWAGVMCLGNATYRCTIETPDLPPDVLEKVLFERHVPQNFDAAYSATLVIASAPERLFPLKLSP